MVSDLFKNSCTNNTTRGLVIVLGASSGWGHMQAAINIAKWLTRTNPAQQVLVLDAYTFVPNHIKWLARTAWRWLSLYAPALYRRIHGHLIEGDPRWKLTRNNQAELEKLILGANGRGQVDAVIATHPAAVRIGAHLKRSFGCQFYVVPTDFVFHNLYCDELVDQYWVTPYSRVVGVKARAVLSEVPLKVAKTGIPLAPEFESMNSSRQLRLQANEDRPLKALVTFGGEGLRFRHNLAWLRKLITQLPDVSWTLICGKDRALQSKLERWKQGQKTLTSLRIEGFSENMAGLMRDADVVLGKAGGLSVSEAAYMKIPLVILDKLPGQEDFNASLVCQNGLGIETHEIEEVVNFIRLIGSATWARAWQSGVGRIHVNCGGRDIADRISVEVEKRQSSKATFA